MKSLPTFTDLPIAAITVPDDRLRPISEAKVAALMQVIGEGLFLGAITVRRSGKTNSLIDGAHRLEAMLRLGAATIRADVLDCNEGEARRLEITGNITEYCSDKYQHNRDIQPSLLYRELNPQSERHDPQLTLSFDSDGAT